MTTTRTHELRHADAVCALRRALAALKAGNDTAAVMLTVDALLAMADAHLLTTVQDGVRVLYTRSGTSVRLSVRRARMAVKRTEIRSAARNGRTRTAAPRELHGAN